MVMKDFFRQPHFKQVFIFGILVYGVALFALIRGDVYYIDDWRHSINGAIGIILVAMWLLSFPILSI